MPAVASDFANFDESVLQACGLGYSKGLGFRFSFAFQPVVDVVSGTTLAQEALVRGPCGEASQSVLARVDGSNRFLFEQLCRVKAIRQAAKLGVAELLSINFMPNALHRPEVSAATVEAARVHGFPLSRLVFESTEGQRPGDDAWLAQVLREYRKGGVLTAIDRFGAGGGSLALLCECQPHFVKLDMALSRGIEVSRARQAVVGGVARVCEQLDIGVIAGGVETPAERDCLVDLGIRLMQGHLFAAPVFEDIARLAPSSFQLGWGKLLLRGLRS